MTSWGSVEHVGLKTTRLRSLSGEQLIFSNADLLGSRVRNYGRMTQRRVVFSLGVTYQTPRTKLEAIPSIIRDAVESQEQTRFDRSHFKAYGGFSIDFETVYYVLAADYNLYMDIQQAINLHIHRQFEEQGIEFAYPTQTLFVSRQESWKVSPPAGATGTDCTHPETLWWGGQLVAPATPSNALGRYYDASGSKRVWAEIRPASIAVLGAVAVMFAYGLSFTEDPQGKGSFAGEKFTWVLRESGKWLVFREMNVLDSQS